MQTSVVSKAANVESAAIYVAVVSGLVGFLIGLATFWGNTVSIFARGVSIGYVVSIVGGFTALSVYLLALQRPKRKATQRWPKKFNQMVGDWSIALVHGLLTLLVAAVGFYIISQAFIGALLDQWASSAIVALSIGLVGYVVYLSARSMSSMRVAIILAMFLVSGTFVSMLTAQDPQWWNVHFSSLGASGGVSGYAFNGTLIIAGLAVVGLAKHITDDFARLQDEKRVVTNTKVTTLIAALIGIGLALALVGIFEYDTFPLIHNSAAGGMAVCFIGIIAALRWLAPDFPKAFFVASYGLFLALIVSAWLYIPVGYFNLTVFELIAAAVIFTWLILFVRHTAALLDDVVNG